MMLALPVGPMMRGMIYRGGLTWGCKAHAYSGPDNTHDMGLN
jgi:hypothetical protein